VSDALQIRPIDILDESQATVAQQWHAILVDHQREVFGAGGSMRSLAEFQTFERQPEHERVSLAVWAGDDLVGAARVIMPQRDNLRLATFLLVVRPEARRRGIGSALLAECEQVAGDRGRSTFLVETEWRNGASDIGEGFARQHGYASAQTVLRSEMRLPTEAATLREVLRDPGAAAYAIETTVDDLPDSWLEDRAVLAQRMSTDAPTDDVSWEEEAWDADRIRSEHEASLRTGRRVLESAVRHLPSARLVAFTRIEVPADRPHLAMQEDTLVLREHRGHSLGLRLKAANALRLMDELPEVTAIRTWNAASNAHMLAVNRQLGYVVDGYSRAWQKVVA
jgi:GNAT superfamily N-acetyltransferase